VHTIKAYEEAEDSSTYSIVNFTHRLLYLFGGKIPLTITRTLYRQKKLDMEILDNRKIFFFANQKNHHSSTV
jgi:hypothetical protein